MNEKQHYDAITDWTLEGRRALLEERGDEIMLLLDEAVTVFLEDSTHSLVSCGFNKGDDPVTEYVEFCMNRFRNESLDPECIWPQDRSFRLFTRVSFWLAQKIGKQGYNARKKKWIADDPFDENVPDTPSATAKRHRDFDIQFEADDQRKRFMERLVETFRIFVRDTVPELGSAWLWGAKRFLNEFSGRPITDALPEEWSDSKRSKQSADAMCRFAVRMLRLLDDPQEKIEPMYQTYAKGCCKPYDHTCYYRKLDKTVGNLLGISSTEAKTQRKTAAVSLMESLIERTHEALRDDDLLLYTFLRESLRKSFFDVHDIRREDSEACRIQLDEWRTS